MTGLWTSEFGNDYTRRQQPDLGFEAKIVDKFIDMVAVIYIWGAVPLFCILAFVLVLR